MYIYTIYHYIYHICTYNHLKKIDVTDVTVVHYTFLDAFFVTSSRKNVVTGCYKCSSELPLKKKVDSSREHW